VLSARKEQYNIMLQNARSFFEFVVLVRRWNAMHGGVYVLVDNRTRPNPYLEDPLRDIKFDGIFLTKMNPAYMTREIGELTKTAKGILIHITSLNPINPHNSPTPLEEKALKSFERGKKEFFEELGEGFFYMAPLITEKPCLKCHAKQGYKEGDIRGGISLIISKYPHFPLVPMILGHLGVGIAGGIIIVIFGLKLEKAYETIEMQAKLDGLTNIPNRRSLNSFLRREMRKAKAEGYPVSVVMCDVDLFKGYNDTYGHDKGDLVLKKVAETIKSSLRSGDFCARYGGEEFVVVLPKTDEEGALTVAERVRENVEQLQIPHEKSPFKVVTISAGVATATPGTEDIGWEELLRRADEALYAAKRTGRNKTAVFTPGSST